MKSKVIRLNDNQINILIDLIEKRIDSEQYYDSDKILSDIFIKELKKIIMKLQVRNS